MFEILNVGMKAYGVKLFLEMTKNNFHGRHELLRLLNLILSI